MSFWIGYGIRQWIIHTRLNRKYQALKMVQNADLQNTENKRKNFFDIADDAIRESNSTKKIFFAMMALAIAIPPLLLTGFALMVLEPIHAPLAVKADELLIQLENKEITVEAFVEKYRDIRSSFLVGNGKFAALLYPIAINLSIALFWAGYGVKKWSSHTKWNKKYLEFQTRDKEINHKLGET